MPAIIYKTPRILYSVTDSFVIETCANTSKRWGMQWQRGHKTVCCWSVCIFCILFLFLSMHRSNNTWLKIKSKITPWIMNANKKLLVFFFSEKQAQASKIHCTIFTCVCRCARERSRWILLLLVVVLYTSLFVICGKHQGV